MDEPGDGDERSVLLGWLEFHRALSRRSARASTRHNWSPRLSPPSNLTLLGLVRHVTEMERVYLVYALGPKGDLTFVYGDYVDGGPEWDFDVDASMVDDSFDGGSSNDRRPTHCCSSYPSLDAIGTGNRRSVRWNLQKLVGEYARHNGHADLLRERIDGSTGES